MHDSIIIKVLWWLKTTIDPYSIQFLNYCKWFFYLNNIILFCILSYENSKYILAHKKLFWIQRGFYCLSFISTLLCLSIVSVFIFSIIYCYSTYIFVYSFFNNSRHIIKHQAYRHKKNLKIHRNIILYNIPYYMRQIVEKSLNIFVPFL